jgi:hypothetical protein
MSEHQLSIRGADASQVLGNPAFLEAMKALREAVVAKWKEVSLRDIEGQRLTLQMMKLADTFEGLLCGFVEAGKFAQNKLDLDKLRDESAARRIMRRVL